MKDLSNKNVIHIKKKDIEYIQFRKLLEYKELVHAFTLRVNDFDIGGNSTFTENKDKYIESYKTLATELEFDYNNIIRPYQTHSDNVRVIEKRVDEINVFPEYLNNTDGLITSNTDIIFSLTFADCTPLFLYDPIKKVIGNIHSGWRGTIQKIGKKAVELMIKEYNCNPKDIICCIGPTIRKDHFEVKQDVEEMFRKEFSYTGKIDEIIIKDNINDSYYIDTVLINKTILKEVGLKDANIIDSNICTVCNSDLIHSYRKKSEGRNTAILGIRGK